EVIESLVTTALPLEAALEPEPSRDNNAVPPIEKSHKLTVVPPIEETVTETHPSAQPTPRRLLLENDPSLNYLDSISRTVRMDEIDSRTPSPLCRRVCCHSR